MPYTGAGVWSCLLCPLRSLRSLRSLRFVSHPRLPSVSSAVNPLLSARFRGGAGRRDIVYCEGYPRARCTPTPRTRHHQRHAERSAPFMGFNMKALQQMQNRMLKMQEELHNSTFEGTSGGGAVTITMNGKF